MVIDPDPVANSAQSPESVLPLNAVVDTFAPLDPVAVPVFATFTPLELKT